MPPGGDCTSPTRRISGYTPRAMAAPSQATITAAGSRRPLPCYQVLKRDRYAVSFYGWNQVHRFMAAWRASGLCRSRTWSLSKTTPRKPGFTRELSRVRVCARQRPFEQTGTILPDVLTWRYTGNDLHPTQKPVMAMAPLIMAFSEPHDIVLDPFAGSGTTAIAAGSLWPSLYRH